jgi:putative NADH-flavin reductase
MKVVIFGATGGTGRHLIEQALAQGHIVTAFDRNPAALTIEHPNLTFVQGDVFNQEQVDAAVAGQDAVICVLGVKPTVQTPVCSTGTVHIVAAMQKAGVKRFICQSAFVVAALDGEGREVPWVLPVMLSFSPKTKTMFADKVRQEQIVRQSDLDWIIVRPARLTDGPKTGAYKSAAPMSIGINSKITRADVADFILKQVSDDSYLHKIPRLSY